MANNISTDIKLSKTQFTKFISSRGFLCTLLGKLADPLMKVGVSLPPLAAMRSASTIYGVIQRKMRERVIVRVEKGITLVISDEAMDNIIRIIKSLENSGVLIDVVSETVKYKIKNNERGSLSILFRTSGASMLETMLTQKGLMRAGKFIARAGRGYNNMDKNFSFDPSFKQYRH